MQKLEQAGCAKPIVRLVVPTGYSFNLDGTNIYMTLAALFIAPAAGVHISPGDKITPLPVAMVNQQGPAGLTSAGVIPPPPRAQPGSPAPRSRPPPTPLLDPLS